MDFYGVKVPHLALRPFPSRRIGWASFLRFLRHHIHPRISVDLGTSRTPILGGSLEPRVQATCLARSRATGALLAVGNPAHLIDGRTPPSIEVLRPMRHGVIEDPGNTVCLLRHLLEPHVPVALHAPRVIVGVPSDATPLERRAVREAVTASGAREVDLVLQPLAAALGAGLPVMEPRGSCVVDIGAGTADIAVISLGGIALTRTVRFAGDHMDEAIMRWLRYERQLVVGKASAEALKQAIGCAVPLDPPGQAEIRGRSVPTGLPHTIVVTSTELAQVLREVVEPLTEQLCAVLDEIGPELAADIFQEGVVLAGGGARLRRLDDYIKSRTGLPSRVAPDPDLCVVRGLERFFDEPALERSLLPREAPSTPDAPRSRMARWTAAAGVLLLALCLAVLNAVISEPGMPTPIEQISRTVIAPLQVASAWVSSVASDLSSGASRRQENERLAARVLKLEEENRRLLLSRRENRRLREMLGTSMDAPWPSRTALVTGRAPSTWSSAITLGVGRSGDVRPGAVVVAPEGVVGRIAEAGPATSRVRLLTDAATVIPCYIRRGGASGILYGDGHAGCELRYIDPNRSVRAGDLVMTSGLNGTYPRGLTVGRVLQVSFMRDQIYRSATVQPVVDAGALTSVLVLVPPRP